MLRPTHLKITSPKLAPYVLLPGDPARVDIIAKYLRNGKLIGNYREFRVYAGRYKNIPVSIVSTGIGCPSTAIAVEEAIALGAKVLIRVGTCGGAWIKNIPLGSCIIPTACVRDEGTTKEYISVEFPAVADIDVVNALRSCAIKQTLPYFLGINRTHDAFYGAESSITKWGQAGSNSRLEKYSTPIISSEMETAALLVIASLRGVKAGAILAVNADPEPLTDRLSGKKIPVRMERDSRATARVVDRTIKVALEALSMIKQTS